MVFEEFHADIPGVPFNLVYLCSFRLRSGERFGLAPSLSPRGRGTSGLGLTFALGVLSLPAVLVGRLLGARSGREVDSTRAGGPLLGLGEGRGIDGSLAGGAGGAVSGGRRRPQFIKQDIGVTL